MIVCCLYIVIVLLLPCRAMPCHIFISLVHIVFSLFSRLNTAFLSILLLLASALQPLTFIHTISSYSLQLSAKECVCLFALSSFIYITIHNIYMWMDFKLVVLCICYVMSLSRSISISRNFYYLLRHHYCFMFIESFKCSFDELTACLALPLTHHPHKWVNEFYFYFNLTLVFFSYLCKCFHKLFNLGPRFGLTFFFPYGVIAYAGVQPKTAVWDFDLHCETTLLYFLYQKLWMWSFAKQTDKKLCKQCPMSSDFCLSNIQGTVCGSSLIKTLFTKKCSGSKTAGQNVFHTDKAPTDNALVCSKTRQFVLLNY